METNDHFHERIRHEQQFVARLRLATERLEEARRERIWAIVEAHQSGLSVRQIATATGLSSSRFTSSSVRTRPARSPGGSAGSAGGTARVSPTFRPASRASWRLSAGATSGWNAWTEVIRSW